MSSFDSKRALGSLTKDERLTTLTHGLFFWLDNIRLGYMVYTPGKGVMIEPYMPNCFPRQLGYDQLYVGNSDPKLHHGGSYFNAARAWYFNINSCTGTCF